MADLAGHRHIWHATPGASRTLLLLHGTGGDEHDLLPLARAVAPDSNVLSPRGNVMENGMPRFFRRLAEGVLDVPDLKRRAADIERFVDAAAAEYGFDRARVLALGYSNGANLAAGLLLDRPGALAGAILARAMVPFEPSGPGPGAGARVLLLAGRRDPYSSPPACDRLAALLRAAGATVDVRIADAGHELANADVAAARAWFAALPEARA